MTATNTPALAADLEAGLKRLKLAKVRAIGPEVLQTALIVGGHECAAEDCEIHGYLERDHLHDFALGGETSLENLIWLCYFHHRLKSRGWILGPPNPITGKRKLFPPQRQVA